MESACTEAAGSEEEDTDVFCLMRMGKNADWLRLFANTEVTIGRGADVTYQLLSPSCPLMISRLHCTFKQREDGQWTVTDKKSLNGVWVNNCRIAAEKAHLITPGDSIQLGVAVSGSAVEFDYTLVHRPLKDINSFLAKPHRDTGTKPTHIFKKPKRKMTEEMEPSTSSKPKLYRCSGTDKSTAHSCPLPPTEPQQQCQNAKITDVKAEESPGDMDNLQMYSQNILMLREQVDSTERQVASLEGQPRQSASFREEQVRELQSQLETLRAKMDKMKTLEKSFNEAKRQLEDQKTQQQEEHLKKQLEDALQEQKKVIDELAMSRQGFEEMLLAKNKELELTKEEKEKERAQKEEVVTQVTEVLENELQCIICSELFIEAVILNCAHGFCCHCIQQWRKKKDECPICRQAIQSQTRCLALDNCIDRMVENLSLEMKTRRQELVNERKGERSRSAPRRGDGNPR
ncbi:E3 ubiquitin-protein ligase rnf8 isoform X2 [Boleophthalmus pectinirostris]|uniref:E3 ubiquitin-protein ligase rnf8 isoform X2 n=1 Tax=Boleophthalmus pectinirostris TaxID=150288 RepID=UPI00242BE793|nr:E3 ubiquitin-protein ligase rnf8 isoform X2 [Boleophthalmus pectinirostris]